MPSAKRKSSIGWPYNSVKYLNRPMEGEKESRSVSPFIGLMPVIDNSDDGSYSEVEATQARWEAASTNHENTNRPNAPCLGHTTNLPSPHKILKIEEQTDSRMVINASEPSPSPPIVSMYATEQRDAVTGHQFQPIMACPSQATGYMIPPPPMPVPNQMPMPIFAGPAIMPQMMQSMPPRPYLNYGTPGPHPYAAQRRFRETRFPIPPPWSGPVVGSPYLAAVPVGTPLPPMRKPVTRTQTSCTQTPSGVLQNYLRPLKGGAGLPDSRLLCPVCGGEEWLVDLITKSNPIIPAPQPHGVTDSRLTCKYCRSNIWQTELLTESYPYIYVPPVTTTDTQWTSCNMPAHPPHMATSESFTTPQHNNAETQSPESGIQQDFPTPESGGCVTSGIPSNIPERGQHGDTPQRALYANIVKNTGRRLDFDRNAGDKWISSFTRLQ